MLCNFKVTIFEVSKSNIMTTTELINHATSRKFSICLDDENKVGICKGKGVWHWFDVYDNGNFVIFNHSYSQNTGRTFKGIMHEIKVKTGLGFYKHL